MVDISNILSQTFVQSFQVYATGSQSGTQLAAALHGGSQSQASQLPTVLQQGARTYAAALQGLNALATYVADAQQQMTQLENITNKLIAFDTSAEQPQTSTEARDNDDLEYQKLGAEFENIVNNAVANSSITSGQNFLSSDGLASLFSTFGLNKDTANSIAVLFHKFSTPTTDTSLASQEEEGSRPIIIPEDAFTYPIQVSPQSTTYTGLFDPNRHINNRPEAYRVGTDLAALKEQIKRNIAALGDASVIVQQNTTLARQVGYAFLNASENQNITTMAEASTYIQQYVTNQAGSTLPQADDLQNLAVAGVFLLGDGSATISSTGAIEPGAASTTTTTAATTTTTSTADQGTSQINSELGV